MLNKLFRKLEEEFVGMSKIHYPVSDSIYHGRMSDAEVEAMRQRNEEAIQKCIENMGEKWIMHPVHQVQRIGNERK